MGCRNLGRRCECVYGCVQGNTFSQLVETGFLQGCFPSSPQRGLSSRDFIWDHIVCNFNNTLPVLDRTATGHWIQECGQDITEAFNIDLQFKSPSCLAKSILSNSTLQHFLVRKPLGELPGHISLPLPCLSSSLV